MEARTPRQKVGACRLVTAEWTDDEGAQREREEQRREDPQRSLAGEDDDLRMREPALRYEKAAHDEEDVDGNRRRVIRFAAEQRYAV